MRAVASAPPAESPRPRQLKKRSVRVLFDRASEATSRAPGSQRRALRLERGRTTLASSNSAEEAIVACGEKHARGEGRGAGSARAVVRRTTNGKMRAATCGAPRWLAETREGAGSRKCRDHRCGHGEERGKTHVIEANHGGGVLLSAAVCAALALF